MLFSFHTGHTSLLDGLLYKEMWQSDQSLINGWKSVTDEDSTEKSHTTSCRKTMDLQNMKQYPSLTAPCTW